MSKELTSHVTESRGIQMVDGKLESLHAAPVVLSLTGETSVVAGGDIIFVTAAS